jgi:SAM-dependent methyltransferase
LPLFAVAVAGLIRDAEHPELHRPGPRRGVLRGVPVLAQQRHVLLAFDAAYLVTVLGEVPGRLAALMELRRVLRPGGRLVIGEFADRPHVPLATLVRLANDAGLHLVRRSRIPLAYYALLQPCSPR